MATLKALKNAFAEMVKVMSLTDDDGNLIEIPKNADEGWLKHHIKEAMELMLPEDEFSDPTTAVLEELKSEMQDEEVKENEVVEATSPEEEEEEPVVEVPEPEVVPEIPQVLKKKKVDISPASVVLHKKNRVPKSSFTFFMDNVILKGGSWKNMIEDLQAESDARGLNYKVSKSTITTHIKYRQKSNPDYFKGMRITEYGIEGE